MERPVVTSVIKKPFPSFSEESFRNTFARLDITDDTKNQIYTWWKDVKSTHHRLVRFENAAKSNHIPRLEREYSTKVYEIALSSFEQINDDINNFLNIPPRLLDRLLGGSLSVISDFVGNKADRAYQIEKTIKFFNGPDLKLTQNDVIAFSEATPKTGRQRGEVLRRKVAQYSFDKIMSGYLYEQMFTQAEIARTYPPSDDLEETIETLRNTFEKSAWSEEEIENKLIFYKSLLELMKKLNIGNRAQIAIKALYKYATKSVPLGLSAIRIMGDANDAWNIIKNDSDLRLAWQEDARQK